MTPFDEIELDLNWREGEIAVMRKLLVDSSISDRTKYVLLRAGWSLLYAHFEGFCKFSLTVYFDAIKKSGKLCREIPSNTQAFAIREYIKEIRQLPTIEFISKVRNFEADIMDKSIVFPEVETEANLKAKVLQKILDDADIVLESLKLHNQSINTLVNRRNKIAHGEQDMIEDIEYYRKYESIVTEIMYDLAISIDAKLG